MNWEEKEKKMNPPGAGQTFLSLVFDCIFFFGLQVVCMGMERIGVESSRYWWEVVQ